MKIKVAAIIEARMLSSRLPGKVLKKINNKEILKIIIERVKRSKKIDKIVVATTTNRKDDKSISKIIKIKDNGNYLFELNKNLRVKNFLCKDVGWVTFKSDNPFLFGWYFEDKGSGVVGGDHCF